MLVKSQFMRHTNGKSIYMLEKDDSERRRGETLKLSKKDNLNLGKWYSLKKIYPISSIFNHKSYVQTEVKHDHRHDKNKTVVYRFLQKVASHYQTE